MERCETMLWSSGVCSSSIEVAFAAAIMSRGASETLVASSPLRLRSEKEPSRLAMKVEILRLASVDVNSGKHGANQSPLLDGKLWSSSHPAFGRRGRGLLLHAGRGSSRMVTSNKLLTVQGNNPHDFVTHSSSSSYSCLHLSHNKAIVAPRKHPQWRILFPQTCTYQRTHVYKPSFPSYEQVLQMPGKQRH